MALLIVEDVKVEAHPVAKGLLEISVDGEIVGHVETLSKSCYRSINTGREHGSQVAALRDTLALFKAKAFLAA